MKSSTKTVITMLCFSYICVFGQIKFAFAHSNPFQKECHSLATINMDHLRLLAQAHNPFWSSVETRQIYMAAINEGAQGIRLFEKNHTINVADKAAIVLAAIVRHDLPMMQANYGSKVDSYFVANLRSNTLYWSAVCNFHDGVDYLLKHGSSPNSNTANHNSAFNVALLYRNSEIPKLLLKNGYDISRNYKWCTSSKYILHRYRDHILDEVAAKIGGTTCRQ